MTDRVLEVLVVEDELLNRALVRAIFDRATDPRLGTARVREADTLAGARAALAESPADLVLLDVQLPDGSGLGLAAELDAAPARPLIIALTAGALPEQREAALRAGCDAVLLKPYSVDEFEAVATAQLSAAGWSDSSA